MRTGILTTALLTWAVTSAQTLPFAYWPLDELGGTMAHDAVGANNGIAQGNTTWQPAGGHHGGALRFYGNDARVDLGPCDVTSGPGDQLSLACWFKPEIVSGNERILMAKAIGPDEADFIWSLSLVNNTGARFRVRTAGIVHTVETPPGNIFSNTWYHIAATYDGHDLRLFINGSTVANGTAEGSIGYHPQAPATIGNLFNNSMPFFGSLDDARVYDQEILGIEVVDLVIGDLATTVQEAELDLWPDGTMTIPPGEWTSMRLLETSGQVVMSSRIGDGRILSLSTVPAGLYLVCLQGSHNTITRRVVKP